MYLEITDKKISEKFNQSLKIENIYKTTKNVDLDLNDILKM